MKKKKKDFCKEKSETRSIFLARNDKKPGCEKERISEKKNFGSVSGRKEISPYMKMCLITSSYLQLVEYH